MKEKAFKENLYPVILLAGGMSKRTGELGPKGLIEVDGLPWVKKQLLSLGNFPKVVVLGYHAKLFQEVLEGDNSLSLAYNAHPERGQFSSLLVGMKVALRNYPHLKGVFIHPVDIPFPSFHFLQEMVALSEEKTLVVKLSFQGKKGHPVFLKRALMEKLLTIPFDADDARLDYQLRKLQGDECKELLIEDKRILMNLNEMSDWRKLCQKEF